jgi:hypothetical protein
LGTATCLQADFLDCVIGRVQHLLVVAIVNHGRRIGVVVLAFLVGVPDGIDVDAKQPVNLAGYDASNVR